jgi:integrase
MKIDAKTVARATLPAGKTDVCYWDDQLVGFGLRLRHQGDKVRGTYIAQYRVRGRTRRFLVGETEKLAAGQAREAARKVLAKVELGEDPQQERVDSRLRSPHTLRAIAQDYLDARKDGLRTRSHVEVVRYLTGGYFRTLHSADVAAITRRDVAACLNSVIKSRGKVAAARARTALSSLYVWAMQQGFTEANPVFGTAVPDQPDARDHVLTNSELAAVWKACEDDDFGKIVQLLILTGARRSEIGGLCWSEINLDDAVWTLPKARAKNKREHRLPLHSLALGIIRSVPVQLGRDHLFGTRSKDGFSAWRLGKAALDKRAGIAEWTLHDVRRTAATRMADIGIAPHIIETILNHVGGHKAGPAGIYNRSSYAREVNAALVMWSDHVRALVTGEAPKVVPFERVAG